MKMQKWWIVLALAATIVSHLAACSGNPIPPTPTMPTNVHALAALLRSTDVQIRLRATDALAAMGPAAAPAVPDLIRALSDVREVRQGAADALAHIGPAAAPAVMALAALLNDDWAGNRAAAARALGSIGPDAKEAIPALAHVLISDQDAFVRTYSAEALGKIGDATALADLLTALTVDTETVTRRAAAMALARFGTQAHAAVPSLVLALSDEEIGVRAASAYAIARITEQPFPDSDTTGEGYRVGADGEALIVVAAREWWKSEGQYENWPQAP